MEIEEMLKGTRDVITGRRVFGEPYERNGVTFIPAAVVHGGGGGGEGDAPDGQGTGRGGGFGLSARPVGAYRIVGDDVTWVPAVDTTKVVIMGQVVAVVALFMLRSMVRHLTKAVERT
jgi:uncharacterized spore protein YtfJ